MTLALETRHLVKRFGGFIATNDVSLQIRQGARHALIGPNGAGKTTIINLLTGVLTPNSGEILLAGEDITGVSSYRRVGAKVDGRLLRSDGDTIPFLGHQRCRLLQAGRVGCQSHLHLRLINDGASDAGR